MVHHADGLRAGMYPGIPEMCVCTWCKAVSPSSFTRSGLTPLLSSCLTKNKHLGLIQTVLSSWDASLTKNKPKLFNMVVLWVGVCAHQPSCRSLRAVASNSVTASGNLTLVVRVFFLFALALDPRADSFSIWAQAFSCWARRFCACLRRSVALRRATVAISASSSLWSAAMTANETSCRCFDVLLLSLF